MVRHPGFGGAIDYRWTCYCMQGQIQQILWQSHLPDVTCQGAVDSAQDHAGCSPGSPCQVTFQGFYPPGQTQCGS